MNIKYFISGLNVNRYLQSICIANIHSFKYKIEAIFIICVWQLTTEEEWRNREVPVWGRQAG